MLAATPGSLAAETRSPPSPRQWDPNLILVAAFSTWDWSPSSIAASSYTVDRSSWREDKSSVSLAH